MHILRPTLTFVLGLGLLVLLAMQEFWGLDVASAIPHWAWAGVAAGCGTYVAVDLALRKPHLRR
jgi:hypothetical protein